MNAVRQGDTIIAPRRAEGPGGIIGDAMITLRPGSAEYDMWDEWLKAVEAAAPETAHLDGGQL